MNSDNLLKIRIEQKLLRCALCRDTEINSSCPVSANLSIFCSGNFLFRIWIDWIATLISFKRHNVLLHSGLGHLCGGVLKNSVMYSSRRQKQYIYFCVLTGSLMCGCNSITRLTWTQRTNGWVLKLVGAFGRSVKKKQCGA